MLVRPEFADYWAYRWSDLFLVSSQKLRPAATWAYYQWIRRQVARNTAWDEFARQIVVAQGSTLENGAANFYVLHEDPRDMSETVSQAFLGMSINCAKCHNHPMEKWTNRQYYQMANLLARVRKKNGGVDGESTIFVADWGDLVQPLTGRAQPPAPLDGEELPWASETDRRVHLANWLVSPENPYFARSIVNRVWANYLGVGLVEPVDDMRITNPSSHEELLSRLAGYLADEKFDLKALMRLIVQSETYQRASEPVPGNETERRFYSRYYPRRLMAEVLLAGLSSVTAVPTKFPNYPEGFRAVQLPDANVPSYFLQAFGRPERTTTCACERSEEPSVSQVLHIANGDTLNQKLGAKANALDDLLKAKLSAEKLVEEVYVRALSRVPTAGEKDQLQKLIQEGGGPANRSVVEDLFWAVLSSKEFLFNH